VPFAKVYNKAEKAAKGPQPGAKALMTWALARYPAGTNLGIYNVRTQRGNKLLSMHAEGRAIDVGFPVERPNGHPDGWRLAHELVEHHEALGVQAVIFARRIWSNQRPTWRPYSGTADHFDHVHAELTREAGQLLTPAIIRAAVAPPAPAPEPTPAPEPAPTPAPATPITRTTKELDVLFHQAMADLDELYRAYTGSLPPTATRRDWGRALAKKLYVEGGDLSKDLAWIESQLRSQAGG
jgi:hypothetical protein